MRTKWIVAILSNIVSMALLVVVMGQLQLMNMQQKSQEKLELEARRLGNRHANEDLLKATMEKRLNEGNKVVADLEAELAKLLPAVEEKRKQDEACHAKKITSNDELAVLQKEHADFEASSKTESDAWNQEINTLKGKLNESSPICEHVKKVPMALTLCGAKPS